MPRLAPDGQRCKEHRITTGTVERGILKDLINQQKADRRQRYISSFALPLSILSIPVGLGVAGYFMATSILQDAKEKLEEVKSNFKNLSNTVQGKAPVDPVTGGSGGIQTALCVQGPQEGNVVTNVAAGIPIVGGLVGWVNNFVTTSNALGDNVWVAVWGNFNKGARRVEELSEGWMYLDLETGGPKY